MEKLCGKGYVLSAKPFFSIVIPVYNVEKYLSVCVDSILNQKDQIDEDIEIILVDDGSKDKSPKICDEYAEKYPEIVKVIHKENEGLLLARRTGFSNAEGVYIINCDSDDFIDKKALACLLETAKNTNADVLIYNISIYENEANVKVMADNIFSDSEIAVVPKGEALRMYLSSYYTKSMCCKAIKRKCIDTDKDYSEFGRLGMGEDALQSLEVYSRADSFVYINKPLYYYRQGFGMTDSFVSDYYFQSKKVFKVIETETKKWGIEDIKSRLATEYFTFLGRSITQGSSKKFTYSERKSYLEGIQNDEYVEKYSKSFDVIKGSLQRNHRIVCYLLMHKKYLMIHFLLSLKNSLRRG